jgi:hypothetical protein
LLFGDFIAVSGFNRSSDNIGDGIGFAGWWREKIGGSQGRSTAGFDGDTDENG